MAHPIFPRGHALDTIAEFRRWEAVAAQDAADMYAKLYAIRNYGMTEIELQQSGDFSPPDLFCRQTGGWACFYLAQPLSEADARVVVLLTTPLAKESIASLEREVRRRRQDLKV
jgi:hypothetical protein